MPLPLIPIAIAIASGLCASGGVAIYKNKKHNEAEARWQDQKAALQKEVQTCQERILFLQNKVADLQKRLAKKEREILDLTKELHECDRMIDAIHKRQNELESFSTWLFSIIRFRLERHLQEKLRVKEELSSACKAKAGLQCAIENGVEDARQVAEDMRKLEHEIIYYEQEKGEYERHLLCKN
jgi:uncharacterized protein HemX